MQVSTILKAFADVVPISTHRVLSEILEENAGCDADRVVARCLSERHKECVALADSKDNRL